MLKSTFLLLALSVFSASAFAQTNDRLEMSMTFKASHKDNSILTELPFIGRKHFLTIALRVSGASTVGEFELRYAPGEKKRIGEWSEWISFQDDEHVELPAGQRQFGMVFLPADARFMEFRVKGLEATVGVDFFYYSPKDFGDTDPIPKAPPADYSACPCPMPNFVSRADWGGPPNQQSNCTPSYTNVTHLFVHHSAGVTNPPYAPVVLAIWQYHVFTNGWCDVGYQWLIAPDGTVFEGRAGGNNVVGAHATGLNGNTMAVCMLGNFQNDEPTPAALASLKALLAWKCCDSDIDPVVSSIHAGSGQVFQHISGHRDGSATLCPGDNMYTKLPVVRTGTDSLYRDPTGCDGIWPPANDNCPSAVTLTSHESCMFESGTTDGTSASGLPIPTCSGFTSGTALDVWYQFSAVVNHHQVVVTPVGNAPDALDPVVAVYEGTCGFPELVACVDAPGGVGVETVLDLPGLVPGHAYFIRVFDFGNVQTADGRFDICVTHGAAVGTEAAEAAGSIRISPNPSSGWVQVRFPKIESEPGKIRVFTMAGQLVLEQNTDADVVDLDLTGQRAGLYFVEFQNTKGVFRLPLVLTN